MTGCSNTGTNIAQGQVVAAVYPVSVGAQDYDARDKIIQENQVDEAFLQALCEFSDKTKEKILQENEKNTAYSPISLYLALAVLADGADGQTKDEMYQLMGISNQDNTYLREQTGKLFRSLYRDDEAVTLKIANSVWARDGFPFLQSYLDSVQKDFYADLYQVDFMEPKTKELMDTWVKDHTGGLITPDIMPTADLVLAIMNTVHLKAGFSDAFSESDTKQDIFTKNNGEQVTCDFMNKILDNYSYLDGDGYMALSLSLSDLGKITLILPDEGVSASELATDTKRLAAVKDYEQYERANIKLSVPKFDASNEIDLLKILESLGMKSAMNPEAADFTNMTKEPVCLTDATQNVRVKLNEEGIEAAAFTMLSIKETAMMEPENIKEIEITMDRPFLYEVTDYDGVVLFTGVLNTPVE